MTGDQLIFFTERARRHRGLRRGRWQQAEGRDIFFVTSPIEFGITGVQPC